jgi:uncharacterized protein YcnI
VTLLTKQAAPGSIYIAVFRVPHGCSGAATTAIRIQIPTGVFAVEPQRKANWMLDVKTGKYAATFVNRGVNLTEGVTEVRWSGGSFPDASYDEFVLSVSLADSLKTGAMLYFPVVQECVGGAVVRWIQIPTGGKVGDDYKTPAPSLKLVAE